jgi:hypothetical protein
MSKPQPAYCTNCGKSVEAKIEYSHGLLAVTCSKQCYKELYWKNVLCIMGKEYYPQPQDKSNDI